MHRGCLPFPWNSYASGDESAWQFEMRTVQLGYSLISLEDRRRVLATPGVCKHHRSCTKPRWRGPRPQRHWGEKAWHRRSWPLDGQTCFSLCPWFSSAPSWLGINARLDQLPWVRGRRLLSWGHYLRDDSFLQATFGCAMIHCFHPFNPPWNFPPSCASVHRRIGVSESVCLCQTYRSQPVMLIETAGDLLPCEVTTPVMWGHTRRNWIGGKKRCVCVSFTLTEA